MAEITFSVHTWLLSVQGQRVPSLSCRRDEHWAQPLLESFTENCYIVATLGENNWDSDLHCPRSVCVDSFSFIGQLDFIRKCLFKFLVHFYWTYSIRQHCMVTCITYITAYIRALCPSPSWPSERSVLLRDSPSKGVLCHFLSQSLTQASSPPGTDFGLQQSRAGTKFIQVSSYLTSQIVSLHQWTWLL